MLETTLQQEMAYLATLERVTPKLREGLADIRGKHYFSVHALGNGKTNYTSNTQLNTLLAACGVPQVQGWGWPLDGTAACMAADASLRAVGLVRCRTGEAWQVNPLTGNVLATVLSDIKGDQVQAVRRYCIDHGVAHWEWQGDGSGDSSTGTWWHNTPTMTSGSFEALKELVESLENECWERSEADCNNEGGYWILEWDPADKSLNLQGTNYVQDTVDAGSASWGEEEEEEEEEEE